MSTPRKRFRLKIFAFTAVALMFLSGTYFVNYIEETEGTAYSYTARTMFNSSTTDYYFNVGDTLTLTHENVFLYDGVDEDGDYYEVWAMYTVHQKNTDLTNSWTNESHTVAANFNGTIRNITVNCYQLNSVVLNNAGDFQIKTTWHYSEHVVNSSGGNGTKTITIHVLPIYTTTFVCNDYNLGGVNVGQFSVPGNSTLTVSNNYATVNGSTATAYTNSIDGYNVSFSGWTYSYDGTNWGWLGTSGSITVTGNVYIGANFSATIKTYSVAYIYNNSQVMWESVNHGSRITHPTYSNGNLVFCGWYYDNNQYFDPNTAVYRDYTLYAYMVEPLEFTSSPVASATITYASSMGSVLFDSLKSESAAKVLWDFGDGTYGKEAVMYHHYDEPGTYNVKLSVYNYNNDVDTKEYVVTVYDAAYPPARSDNTLLIAGSVMAALVVGFIIARPF